MRIFLFIIFFFQFPNLNAQQKLSVENLSITDQLKYVKNECKQFETNTENFFRCSIDTHIYNYNFYKNIYEKKTLFVLQETNVVYMNILILL